jgi:hypothetical protein
MKPKRRPIRVVMFQPDFESPITDLTKRHTIRPPLKRPIPIDAIISCRVWRGKPYRTKQREFARFDFSHCEGVIIHKDGVEISPGTARYMFLGEWSKTRRQMLEHLAQRDGFPDWPTMRDWFQKTHTLPFTGTLIHWHPVPLPIPPADE